MVIPRDHADTASASDQVPGADLRPTAQETSLFPPPETAVPLSARRATAAPPSPAAPSPETVRAELPRIPVLLLAGGHDLSTPLAGARAQAALAPDGHLFVVPTAGHSVQNRAAGDPAAAELARFLG